MQGNKSAILGLAKSNTSEFPNQFLDNLLQIFGKNLNCSLPDATPNYLLFPEIIKSIYIKKIIHIARHVIIMKLEKLWIV